MNRFFVVFATIVVAVNARSARQGWGVPSGGWAPAPTAPPPTAAPGWPAPTVAPGWPAPAPAPGWAAPPAANTVAIAGDLAAAGDGWAASSQDVELFALDTTPDGVDPSQVSQVGVISQSTGINPIDLIGVQTIDVNQIAIGAQGIDAYLAGSDLATAHVAGWTGASGQAESSANGAVNVLSNVGGRPGWTK